MKNSILGYRINSCSPVEIVQEITQTFGNSDRNCHWLACINPHSYAVARHQGAFAEALRGAHWLVADGVGIVLAGRILGRPFASRVTGFDVFDGVMRKLNEFGGSVFFLGSTEKTLTAIRDRVAVDFPRVHVEGTYSPPYKPTFSAAEIDEMIAAVNRTGADVLWVGMTAPKQEMWIHEHRDRLSVGFAGAIGAVFDFYTGQVPRSHPAFQRLGLEWLPRLLRQPRRLWRRTFVSAPIFLYDVAYARLRD